MIGDAFVVVVVGGMGSITGAYLAAVIIAEVKALCIGLGVVDFGFITVNFSKFTLVAEFLVMAIVLIVRPYGLLGKPQGMVRSIAEPEEPIRPANRCRETARRCSCSPCCCACRCSRKTHPYLLVLGIDVLIAVLFATSLHFIMGPGGMHSFGHAAYFGLGAYGAALLVKWLAVPMGLALAAAPVAALAGALLFGWFAVRLSGVYLAMLTLAFAQIVWARCSSGKASPAARTAWSASGRRRRSIRPGSYFLLTLVLAVLGVLLLRRIFVRAVRLCDARRPRLSVARRSHRHRRQARALARLSPSPAASAASPAGCSPSPRARSRRRRSRRPLDRRPGHGAARRHADADRADRRRRRCIAVLQDTVMRQTEYWRALLGGIILLLVLAFPRASSAPSIAVALFEAPRAGAPS